MKKLYPLFAFLFVLSKVSSAQEACFQNNIGSRATIEAYWPMDGNANDILAASGINNPVSINGVTFTTLGAFSGSHTASFDGSGGIQYDNGSFMNNGFTNLAFGAWIKPTAVTGSNQMIFEEGGDNGISLFLGANGRITAAATKVGVAATANDTASYAYPTDNIYHHVAVTYQNGTLRVFLDGLLQKATNSTLASISAASTAGAGVGSTFNGSSAAVRLPGTYVPFNGLIDEVFYTRNSVTEGNLLQYARCHGRNLSSSGVSCIPEGYFILGISNDGQYSTMNLVTGQLSTAQTDGYVGTQNSIGYNSIDGLIYGVNYDLGYLFSTEVTANGAGGYIYNTKILSYYPNLVNSTYVTGDAHNGMLYLKDNNRVLQIIDINPGSPTYLQLLTGGGTITGLSTNLMTDWAYYPDSSRLYGVDGIGDLYSIDPVTRTARNLGNSITPRFSPGSFAAAFFDSDGFLYVYDVRGARIYRIDIKQPVGGRYPGIVFGLGQSGVTNNDGARCIVPLPLDFADAPDISTATTPASPATGTNQYRTMLSNDGPRHLIDPSYPLTIGSAVTRETDGKPSASAGLDQDDGVTTSSLINLVTSKCLNVTVNNPGSKSATLYAWIDINRNGRFETTEFASATVNAGTSGNVQVCFPASFTFLPATNYYIRLRLTTGTITTATTVTAPEDARSMGGAPDGEVEDYLFNITSLPVAFGAISATINNGNLTVKWTTLFEKQNDYFVVEGSKDGQKFYELETINSKSLNGDSDVSIHYELTKNMAGINFAWLGIISILCAGIVRRKIFKLIWMCLFVASLLGYTSCNKSDLSNNDFLNDALFIRIKQVDKDGHYKYSDAIKAVRE